MENKIRFSEVLKKYTMVIVLALVIILFTVNTGGKMLLPQNVNNLIVQNAYVFILATGMLFCILTGGNIDLSVGSVVCFVGAVGGKMMVTNGMNPYLTMVVMLLVGLLIGAWQGFWIAYVRIPPFIVTLAGMLVFRGLSNVVLEGMTLAPMPDNFLALFNNYIPDFFGMEGFNMTCFLVGVVVCVLYVFMVLKGRASRAKKVIV
jgi:multiple monosaccharide ABC transporter membrane protein